MIFWSNNNKSQIYFCAEKNLISLNAENGNLIKDFGIYFQTYMKIPHF